MGAKNRAYFHWVGMIEVILIFYPIGAIVQLKTGKKLYDVKMIPCF